ncbi:MAG: outer membrane lipoprotein-sorting protein [Chthoniobacterales bacterium]
MSAQELIAQLDRIRQPSRSYRAEVAVIEFRQGKREREGTFQLYARKVPAGFDVLARCLNPAADRNKLFLATGGELWFYDPRSARPLPISPNQFRSHQLILELLSEPIASQYSGELEAEQPVADLSRRQVRALRLALRSRKSRSGTAAARYWLTPDDYRPIKSEILSTGGRSIRTVYYSEFKKVLGEERPTRLVLLNPAESSVVELKFSDYAQFDAPGAVFDEDRLPNATNLLAQISGD